MSKQEKLLPEKDEIEEKKVSVEMSESEKDDFAKWVSDKKLKEEKEIKEPDVTVDLRMGHNVNGRPYGPGRVQVPEGLGYALSERDELAVKARMRVHEGSEFMIEILGSGRSVVREVKKAGP